MEIASVRETANFTNKTNAVSPYTLGQILASFSTQSWVLQKISEAEIDPGQIPILAEYAKLTDLPTRLSQLTNDDNYVQTVSGKIPAGLLPSYVDDVLEFPSLEDFPIPGESGKIYIALDTNSTYRWGGTSYVNIGNSLSLGETSTTAYRGDRGKTAYEHSQETGNAHNLTIYDLGITATATELSYISGLSKNIVTALGEKLSLSGGTMTGYITLHHAPTQLMHAVNKDYVDTLINGISVTVTQTIANVEELQETATGHTQTLAQHAATITEVENDITGLNQTTTQHSTSINQITEDVSGVTRELTQTKQTVTVLSSSVNQLSVDLENYYIVVPIDENKRPLNTATYDIGYTCKFRGVDVQGSDVVKTITGQHTGITITYDGLDISVSVSNISAIPEANNTYIIKFDYTTGGFTYSVSKTLTLTTVPKGSTGAQGPQGNPGTPGADGTTYYTWIKYADNAQGSGMSDDPTGKAYMGVAYNKTTPTESTTPSDYAWSKIKGEDGQDGEQGPKGETGDTGPKGDDGADGADGRGIESRTVTYKATSSYVQPTPASITSLTPPTLDPTTNKYLWQKEFIEYTNGDHETIVTCIAIYGDTGSQGPKGDDGEKGDKGDTGATGPQGATGVSVSSIVNYYAVSQSQTTAPSTGWNTVVPSRGTGYYLWIKELITFSNSTTSWGTPHVVTGDAGDDGVIKSDTAPSDTSKLWYDTVSGKLREYEYSEDEGTGSWNIVNDFTSQLGGLDTKIGDLADKVDENNRTALEEIENINETISTKIQDEAGTILENYTHTIDTKITDAKGEVIRQVESNLSGYIRRGTDSTGVYIELGEQASAYKLRIENDQIKILYNDQPVSTWKNDQFDVNTVITEELKLGNFSFLINEDKSISFRKVRDE